MVADAQEIRAGSARVPDSPRSSTPSPSRSSSSSSSSPEIVRRYTPVDKYDASAPEAYQDDDSVPDDSSGQLQQLVNAWNQSNAARLAMGEQAVLQTIQQFLQLMCGGAATNNQGCDLGGTGTGYTPIPRSDLPERRAYNRFSKKLPPAPLPRPAAPASPPKPKPAPAPQGCFQETYFTLIGNGWGWSPPGAFNVYFTTAYSDVLVVENNTAKELWVGTNVPLNRSVSPGDKITIELPRYRKKGDYTASVADLGIKYWTTDPSACADGGVHAGPSTLEEMGGVGGPPGATDYGSALE
jgi:hypothetical protein